MRRAPDWGPGSMRLNRFLSPSSLPSQALGCSAVLLVIVCLGSILNAHRCLPNMNPTRNSSFCQIDFAQIYLNQQAGEEAEHKNGRIQDQQLVDSGGVSVRDLQAPSKAIKQFNRGTSFLKSQDSKDAIRCLE